MVVSKMACVRNSKRSKSRERDSLPNLVLAVLDHTCSFYYSFSPVFAFSYVGPGSQSVPGDKFLEYYTAAVPKKTECMQI
jgi:hypothetical protein